MITIISPAKTVDFEQPAPTAAHTIPDYLFQSRKLVRHLKRHSKEQLMSLMSVSENIAELNVKRYKKFRTPFRPDNAKQAIYAFRGDVYRHMRINTYDEATLDFAQQSLRILSGLYGCLRPLDLIQPYRLEMKTRLANDSGPDLYRFWGDRITKALNKELRSAPDPVLINLASREYAKVIDFNKINVPVITIEFKEVENNEAKVIAIFAKWARGMMADHIIRNQITDPTELQNFNESGYKYSESASSEDNWVFLRPRPE